MLKATLKGAAIGAALVLAVCFIAALAGAAAASQPSGNVCGPLTTGKIDVTGSVASVTYTAPEGQLITGYCVKAGSAKQGLGPEYVVLPKPVSTVTISHSTGKDVSHYSVTLTAKPTPTETEATPTPTPTETKPTPTPTDTEDTPTPTATPSGTGGTPDDAPDAPNGPDKASDTLPRTGAGTAVLALLSLALLVTGAALLKGTRKRA